MNPPSAEVNIFHLLWRPSWDPWLYAQIGKGFYTIRRARVKLEHTATTSETPSSFTFSESVINTATPCLYPLISAPGVGRWMEVRILVRHRVERLSRRGCMALTSPISDYSASKWCGEKARPSPSLPIRERSITPSSLFASKLGPRKTLFLVKFCGF